MRELEKSHFESDFEWEEEKDTNLPFHAVQFISLLKCLKEMKGHEHTKPTHSCLSFIQVIAAADDGHDDDGSDRSYFNNNKEEKSIFRTQDSPFFSILLVL